jgi:hypothetical protein
LEAARSHGAIRGVGHGRQGKSYAIPTKDFALRTLPLPMIQYFVRVFLDHARINPNDRFKVVPIGCGLAGYKPHQIAPFFDYAPVNVYIPHVFI